MECRKTDAFASHMKKIRLNPRLKIGAIRVPNEDW